MPIPEPDHSTKWDWVALLGCVLVSVGLIWLFPEPLSRYAARPVRKFVFLALAVAGLCLWRFGASPSRIMRVAMLVGLTLMVAVVAWKRGGVGPL